MDPQQRLLLEHAYAALHGASQSKPLLMGACVGVYVGVWACEYQSVLNTSPAGQSVYAATAATCSVVVGRLSKKLPCAHDLPSASAASRRRRAAPRYPTFSSSGLWKLSLRQGGLSGRALKPDLILAIGHRRRRARSCCALRVTLTTRDKP